jgi:hypothetical protein
MYTKILKAILKRVESREKGHCDGDGGGGGHCS